MLDFYNVGYTRRELKASLVEKVEKHRAKHLRAMLGCRPMLTFAADTGAEINVCGDQWLDRVFDKMVLDEVVVLKSDYEARLPHAIRAFFCVRSQECAEARAMRDHFVSAYLPKHRRIADELPVLRYLGGEDGFVDARDRESESRHV